MVYNSFDILLKAVNTYAATEGFALAIKRSKKSKKGILCKVWLECDKSGSYKAKGHGVRQTSTMKDECPCEIIATRHSEQNTWMIEIKCSNHNHPPTFARADANHRRAAMTDDIKLKIVTQTQVDGSARQILSSIRLGTDEENPFYKAKDIYNQHYYHRCKELGLFSPVQALMYKLNEKKGWYIEYFSVSST